MRIFMTCVVLAALLGAAQSKKSAAEVSLGQAVHQEEVEANLPAAIAAYKKALSQAGGNRALAAKALVGLGRCYEKQGNKEARQAYESVIRQYADQKDAASEASGRLNALRAPGKGGDVELRRLSLPSDPNVWNVSADGRYMGATLYETGNAAIVDVATGKHTVVTNYGSWNNANGYIDLSAISRDGKQIAFWHYKNGATEGNLRVTGADGRGERVLYQSPHRIRGDIEWGMPLDWSPDGTQIVTQLERGKSLTEGVMDIALIPVNGGRPKVVKTAEYIRRIRPKIAFSSDGKYLAYDYPRSKERVEHDIHVLSLADGRETVIAEGPSRDTFFGWTPAGDILFLSNRSASQALYRIGIKDGKQAGEPILLRQELGQVSPLGVSASGGIYYQQTRTISNAKTMGVDLLQGKVTTQPQAVSDLQDVTASAAWSPDGRQLMWGVQPAASRGWVTIRDEESGKQREVHPQASLGTWLAWHRDGKSILARGQIARGSQSGLFHVDAVTGESRLIGPSNMESWSEDGEWTFHQSGQKQTGISRKKVGSGEETEVFGGGKGTSRANAIRLSPDGKWVFFRQEVAEGIAPFVVPAEGGDAKPLSGPTRGVGWPFIAHEAAWTADSQAILVVVGIGEGNSRQREIWMYSRDGGEPKKLDYSTKHRIEHLAVHPNGKRMAFTITERKTEHWAIHNLLTAQ